MTLVLHYAARSDRGLVRSNNQDSVYAGPRLLALADGMGGHAAGEVASKVVIAALAPLDDDEPGDDLLGKLRSATVSGNGAISELVASDPELDGMGTTLTAVLFAGSKLGLVHIGDSRAYLVRDGELAQVTHDDTFVQSLIDEGRITEEDAAVHPQRSLLLRALTGHEFEPSLTIREARAGDRYLLCSDGLSSVVSEETIAEALRIGDPQQSADRLIELALKGGGPDNVTVIVADVVDVEFGDDAPIVAGAAGFTGDDPHPDSAAARASAFTNPQQPGPQTQHMQAVAAPAPPRRRRWLPAIIATTAVVAVLVGLVFAGRWWVFNQYYVGVNKASEVVIFQGIQGSLLGLSLHRQVARSCAQDATAGCEPIKVNDLKEGKRVLVRNGISVEGMQNGKSVLHRLRRNGLLPACDKPDAQPKQPPTVTNENKPTRDTTSMGDEPGDKQNRPARRDQSSDNSTKQAKPSRETAASKQSEPPRTSDSTAPSATPLRPEKQKPGITCRTVS